MIGALDATTTVAFAIEQTHSAMTADVEKSANYVIFTADNNHAVTPHVQGDEVTRVLQVTGVSGHLPAIQKE
jgi:hypothetical protein